MSVTERQSGSIFVAALIVALVIGGLVGAFLRTVTQEIKDSHRSRMALQAINLAEAGLEYAIDAIHRDDWTGWSKGTKGNFRDSFPFTTHTWHNNDREVSVYVEMGGSLPRAVAEGIIRTADGIEVRRQVMIELGNRSLFASGLVAKNSVVFSGNNVYIDSYRSSKGAYNSAFNSNDNGSVASISIRSDAVVLGNGDVWGRVATGGSNPDVGPNGTVRGKDSPAGVKIDFNRVATDFYAELPDPVEPTLSSPSTSISSSTAGTPGTATEYKISGINLSGKSTLTIQGDVTMIVTGDLALSGQAQIVIAPNSSLVLYVRGDMDATGNGIINQNNQPQNLQIYGTGTGKDTKIAGNAGFYGMVYAPNNEVVVVGNGEFFGALVGEDLQFTGNATFHYDEDLADFGNDGLRRVTRWVELTDASSRKNMATILTDGF
jgi:hypothetical protein